MKKVLIICFALLMSATCAFAASETIDELIAQLEGKTPEEITQAREEKNKAEENRKELEALEKQVRISRDRVTGTNWIYSKKTNIRAEERDSRTIYLYAIDRPNKGGIGSLYYCFGYTSFRWIFMQKVLINVDGKLYEFPFYAAATMPFSGCEYKKLVATSYDQAIFRKIADSKSTIVRFVGYSESIEFVVSKAQKEAIDVMLRYNVAKRISEGKEIFKPGREP